jgi:DNA-binding HxlR family transcriptional regulator
MTINPDPSHWNRLDYSADNCSLLHALDIVGDKWAIPILREAFFGIRRFSDFQRSLGCARNLLSTRLSNLVAADLLEIQSYQVPGQRKRNEYRITEKGRDLLPVLIALLQWGDRWAADPAGPPVHLAHRNCNGRVYATITCEHGHLDLKARDIEISAGPGAIRLAPK